MSTASNGSPRINVGIVGFGYWGPNLLRNFTDNPRTAVTRVCDVDPARRESAARRAPHVRTTQDFNDLLADDVDLIAVATPVESHYPLAMAAIAAKKHVLVEKPLCSSLREADELQAAARAAGMTVFVDHTFVFTPAVRKMAEIVNAPSFGRPLYYDSVRVNLGLFHSDVSVLWDLAPHDLSILDYVLGGALPESVSCVGAAHFGHVESIAYLTMRYAQNFIAHIHVNWLAPVKIRQVLVGGTGKLLMYDDVDPVEKIRVFDKGVLFGADDARAKRQQLVEYRLGDIFVPMVATTEALKIEVDHIAACLLDDANPVSGIRSGRNIVAVLDAAQRSLECGGAPQDVAVSAIVS